MEDTREELKGQKEMLARQAVLMEKQRHFQELQNLSRLLHETLERIDVGKDIDRKGVSALKHRLREYSKSGGNNRCLDNTIDQFIAEESEGTPRFLIPLFQILTEYLDYIDNELPLPCKREKFEQRGRLISHLFCQFHQSFAIFVFLYIRVGEKFEKSVFTERHKKTLFMHNAFRFIHYTGDLTNQELDEIKALAKREMEATEEWQIYQAQLKDSTP